MARGESFSHAWGRTSDPSPKAFAVPKNVAGMQEEIMRIIRTLRGRLRSGLLRPAAGTTRPCAEPCPPGAGRAGRWRGRRGTETGRREYACGRQRGRRGRRRTGRGRDEVRVSSWAVSSMTGPHLAHDYDAEHARCHPLGGRRPALPRARRATPPSARFGAYCRAPTSATPWRRTSLDRTPARSSGRFRSTQSARAARPSCPGQCRRTARRRAGA